MAITAESTDIFRRVIEPDQGSMSVELARFVDGLDFLPEDHARYEALSEKARLGTPTQEEENLLDDYLHVNSLVSILRLKASQRVEGQHERGLKATKDFLVTRASGPCVSC
jgi:hypothetical protein